MTLAHPRRRDSKFRDQTDPMIQSLRLARLRAGVTQAQLERKLGITRGMVSHYERGAALPPLPLYREWAAQFGLVLVLVQARGGGS